MDLSGLAGIFVGIHVQLAQATQVPEFVIEQEEGDEFLKRAQAMMSHYSVETTQKTIDWLAFIGVGSMIYGTRFIAYNARVSRERKERGEPPRSNVVRHPRNRAAMQGAPSPDAPLVIEPNAADFEE